MMSASLPGSIVPSSALFPRIEAPAGQGGDDAAGGHPHVDVRLGFAPERFGMEVHRGSGVGTHSHDGTGLDELLETPFPEEHLPTRSPEVAKRAPVRERVLNLLVDFGPKVRLQLRVLKPLGKRDRVRVDPAPVRRGHDDRAAGVDDVGDELCAVGRGRAGRARVGQDIEAGVEAFLTSCSAYT